MQLTIATCYCKLSVSYLLKGDKMSTPILKKGYFWLFLSEPPKLPVFSNYPA